MFGQLPQSAAELDERQAASLTLSTGMYVYICFHHSLCLHVH